MLHRHNVVLLPVRVHCVALGLDLALERLQFVGNLAVGAGRRTFVGVGNVLQIGLGDGVDKTRNEPLVRTGRRKFDDLGAGDRAGVQHRLRGGDRVRSQIGQISVALQPVDHILQQRPAGQHLNFGQKRFRVGDDGGRVLPLGRLRDTGGRRDL